MTRVRAVGRLRWAAMGAGLVLAGCGSAAAGTAQLSHAASPRGPANGSAPKASAVQPNGGPVDDRSHASAATDADA